jgi:hypothetical protein
MFRSVIGLTLFFLLSATSQTFAAPIAWQYDLLIHGVAVVANDNPPPAATLLTIPAGTPMTVTVFFDTDTPAVAGGDEFCGTYLIGGTNTNHATVDLLGYRYAATGGIEINSVVGQCSPQSAPPPASSGGVRLFLGAASPIDPDGTLVLWPASQFGQLFLLIPPSAVLGAAFPSGLLPEPFPFGGHNFINTGPSQSLFIDATDLHLIPETPTVILTVVGLLAAISRRRRSGFNDVTRD